MSVVKIKLVRFGFQFVKRKKKQEAQTHDREAHTSSREAQTRDQEAHTSSQEAQTRDREAQTSSRGFFNIIYSQ
ncbi:hypothetical protein GCM10008935_13950 [Alkalibacillus silvisoli]|uniref:Uncharacterized protein n=1 Tax=Alkalibacillus silvisoli TaxID=392823 RepID=A0ABP3JNW6_9BACI